MMQKPIKMAETLANGYSSESTQQGISNGYQHDNFQEVLRPCALDESRLSIGRVKDNTSINSPINSFNNFFRC